MKKIEIDKEKPLNPGDRIELHFKSTSMAWIKAAQIALIDNRLDNRKDFEILSFETPVDQPTLIKCRVEVKDEKLQETDDPELQRAGFGMNCLAVATVIIATGVVYKLTFEKSFLIVPETAKELIETPTGKVAVAGAGIGIAALGVAAVLAYILPRSKG